MHRKSHHARHPVRTHRGARVSDTRTSRRAATVEEVAPGDGHGWTSAAIAICSIMQIPTPMLLRLSPDDLEPIYVDFRFRAFQWGMGMDEFPVDPARVYVETEAAPDGSPPLFDHPGRNVDVLLWAIGSNSFPDAAASWLRPGEAYRLRRWPNLTDLDLPIDDIRHTSLLGNAYFTATSLATAADTTPAAAQRMINALSLMGVLAVSAEAAESRVAVERDESSEARGLFSRLRNRLGR
jgi:hypothetical protein